MNKIDRKSEGGAKQTQTKKIIAQLAEEFDLPYTVVERIVDYPFKCLVGSIRAGVKNDINTFKNYLIRYLGTFVSSPSRMYIRSKCRKLKLEKDESIK